MIKNFLIIIFILVTTLTVHPAVAEANLFGGQIVQCDGVDSEGAGFIGPRVRECDFTALMATARALLICLIQIAIAFAIIMLAWGGFQYLTSGGSETKISKGHTILKNAVLGLVLALAGFLVIELLFSVLGVKTTFSLFTGSFGNANPGN